LQHDHDAWEKWLGRQRLDSYLRLGSNLPIESLAHWNQYLSGLLLSDIGHVEIAIRNLMSDALQNRVEARGINADWFEDPTGEFAQCGGVIATKRLREARARAQKGGSRINQGDVIAELSLGFWSSLLSKSFQRLHPDLVSLFRGSASRNASSAHALVSRVLRLRNRAAHQHRMIHRDLRLDYQSVLDLAEAIDPRLAEFISGKSRTLTELNAFSSLMRS
jgi:hypothetical protein